MILIDPHDPRGPKAVKLATQALTAGWPSMRAFFMPSASDPAMVYVTTRFSCECKDFHFRGPIRRCYHAIAVELIEQARDEVAAF